MLAPQYEFDPYKTHIECFLFKSLHYLQAYTKNLLHMEGIVSKTTTSQPKVMLN